ncbi:MAG: UDP-N-acetylmuramoyl-tripeptide--D-alanyl-D-alanine ligase [Acidobacteria bacterium]|nr:UDP-N-acetylmuramoyl-tripeptide--D-alanyl-D-alanine ligase [Acidobacteriota bacterium]
MRHPGARSATAGAGARRDGRVARGEPVRLRADELAAAAGGVLVSGRPERTVEGFSIDSRRIRRGDWFVAIRGERFDGHGFIADALQQGAAGVIASDRNALPGSSGTGVAPVVIVVDDTTEALQSIARHIRRRSGAQVVAITGSVGKTTTKELTAAFLATRHSVVRNPGNLNNHIGLPLSLLELRHGAPVAVMELGMNHAGEIRTLVGIAEPNVRVWTNVREVHAESFPSVEAIADAKAEILEGAGPEDHLVTNAGDPRAMARIAGFPGGVTTFGVGTATAADVCATAVADRGLDGWSTEVRTPAGDATVRSRLVGAGHVANVLAAIAVALRFGVRLDAMVETAAAFGPPPRRGEVIRLRDGITLVDDSYNSNPAALAQILASLGRETAHARRVAVLGEMRELGDRASELHRESGRAAREAGFDLVIAVGSDDAAALTDGARAAGLPAAAAAVCADSDAAADVAIERIRPGDLVLVKGSRGTRTEVVADRLKEVWA